MKNSVGDLTGRSLALIPTFRGTLEQWDETGIIDRELAIYNELAEEFDEIYLFTYGEDEESEYGDHVADDIEIISRELTTINILYSLLLPFIHYEVLFEVDVVKTNQTKGAWTAVIATLITDAELVVRTGYVYSRFQNRPDSSWWSRFLATLIEWIAYSTADGIITSSRSGYQYVERRYNPSGIHEYIPNYIETDVFKPIRENRTSGTLCTVGRLTPQKNFENLIRAVGQTDYKLTIIGDGPRYDHLSECVDQCGADVEFRGRVPNHDLPGHLTEHEAFVLPSYYEGMPKALLEAMSCGLPVVATDVQGSQEVLIDARNGILCDTAPEEIREGIERVMQNADMRERLGRNARRTIRIEYSLDSYLPRELSLYRLLFTD